MQLSQADVKDARALRIGFVGAGRVAGGLSQALDAAGFSVTAVASRSMNSAHIIAECLDSCHALATPQAVADHCDLVFITTPDAAIADTAVGVAWRAGQAAVHCSGATDVSALDSAAANGAHIGGFHPIQSFGDPKVSARALSGSTITIEADMPLDAVLASFAAGLGCHINHLPPGKRALYHASAGYGAQFINVLLAETAEIWAGWGASEDDVTRAILPMVRGTLDAISANGIAGGMPGPVSRGDAQTVAAHVTALQEIGGSAFDFYRVHCHRSIDLAEADGRIDTATAKNMRRCLDP